MAASVRDACSSLAVPPQQFRTLEAKKLRGHCAHSFAAISKKWAIMGRLQQWNKTGACSFTMSTGFNHVYIHLSVCERRCNSTCVEVTGQTEELALSTMLSHRGQTQVTRSGEVSSHRHASCLHGCPQKPKATVTITNTTPCSGTPASLPKASVHHRVLM